MEGARPSTPCCCASTGRRSATSSPTAAPSRRCRRGASRAAGRSTTSRSRTSSTTSSRSRSLPTESQELDPGTPGRGGDGRCRGGRCALRHRGRGPVQPRLLHELPRAAPTPAVAATPPGWSYNDKTAPTATAPSGPSLRGGSASLRFPGAVPGFDQQVDFVCAGQREGRELRPELAGHRPHAGLLPDAGRESTNVGETGEVGVEAQRALRSRHRRRHVRQGGRREDRPLRQGPVNRGSRPLRHDLGPRLPGPPRSSSSARHHPGRLGVPAARHQQRVAASASCSTFTALAGWMMIMGLVWSMYGIG